MAVKQLKRYDRFIQSTCEGCGCVYGIPLSHRRQRFHSVQCAADFRAVPIETRFWSKVDKTAPSGCWLWTASVNANGYGMFRVDNARPTKLAHRFSYELAHGVNPGQMHVCHQCDTPRCVNPAHLWLGTDADNLADMRAKGRANDSVRAKGEQHGCAKISQAQALAVLAQPRAESHASISRRLGVGYGTVKRIRNGLAWKHLRTNDDARLA